MCSLRMVVLCVVVAFALTLLGPCPSVCAPQGGAEPDEQPYDLVDFDMNGETDWENLDLNGENYDYEDLDKEVKKMGVKGRGGDLLIVSQSGY